MIKKFWYVYVIIIYLCAAKIFLLYVYIYTKPFEFNVIFLILFMLIANMLLIWFCIKEKRIDRDMEISKSMSKYNL